MFDRDDPRDRDDDSRNGHDIYDPRWDADPRDRDENWDEPSRDQDRDRDPRDSFVEGLDLPRGPEREIVLDDRDRTYELNGEDSRTLATIGAFRVVSESDLRGPHEGSFDPRNDHHRHLRDQGLMRSVSLNGRERVVTLTERGRSLLECHRRDRDDGRHQQFSAGINRPRELTHDASLYRAYLRAETRLREQGAEIRRVVLENDLKREYQCFLQEHKEAFGDLRALDITPDRVREYQAHRRAEDASPATVNRETSHLARAFRIAVKSGLLTIVPPFPNRLEESAPRQGFFEHAEYLAVRQHLTPAVYQDVLDFAYYSGWRRGEITGLTWREIDMAGSVIRLDPERSKTKTGRLLPMSQPLKEVLQRRVATRRLDSLMVFHRGGEEMIDWRKAWAAACKLAGLPGKRLHDCRRTAARNLIRSGTPERVAMQLTGHKTRTVFDRYNIVSESDLKAGVDRLAAYVKKLPKETIVEPLKKAGKGRG